MALHGKCLDTESRGAARIGIGWPSVHRGRGAPRSRPALAQLDRDGVCELIVGNPQQQAVFAYHNSGWQRLPFRLPEGTTIVDAEGRDAGLRFVDFDEDGHANVVFSNAQRYAACVFHSMTEGWSRKMLAAERPGEVPGLPMIVPTDGTNNGEWFNYRHMWVQNEETGGQPPQVEVRSFTHDLLRTEKDRPRSVR